MSNKSILRNPSFAPIVNFVICVTSMAVVAFIGIHSQNSLAVLCPLIICLTVVAGVVLIPITIIRACKRKSGISKWGIIYHPLIALALLLLILVCALIYVINH